MDNNAISAALEEIAMLLELKGENPFKARAYSTAARTVRALEEEVEKLVKESRLRGIPGIGDSIREKVTELVTKGHLQYLDDLRAAFPKGLMAMLEVEGLGPKKVKLLWEELKKACAEGRIAGLKGMGEKTQKKIMESIEKLSKTRGRFLLPDARAQAEQLVAKLRALPEAVRVELAGSTRRGRETVKDVDILVASAKPQAIMDAAAKLAP